MQASGAFTRFCWMSFEGVHENVGCWMHRKQRVSHEQLNSMPEVANFILTTTRGRQIIIKLSLATNTSNDWWTSSFVNLSQLESCHQILVEFNFPFIISSGDETSSLSEATQHVAQKTPRTWKFCFGSPKRWLNNYDPLFSITINMMMAHESSSSEAQLWRVIMP